MINRSYQLLERPQNVAATKDRDDGVEVTWDCVDRASYWVYFKIGNGELHRKSVTGISCLISTNTYEIAFGQTVQIYVMAHNPMDVSEPSSTVVGCRAAIPDLGSEPTRDDIYQALDGSADEKLVACITNASNYASYREWAMTVKDTNGVSMAGAQGVKSSPNAWVSFALKSDKLLAKAPSDDDLTIEKFEPASESGMFDFTISVNGVIVGSDAQKENLKQVFGLEGATQINSDEFSPANVDLVFDTPVDGRVKFTAGPRDENASTFFMRVKIAP